MARYLFGGRTGDFTVVDPATTGAVLTASLSQTGGTVWTAQTGGSQLTDLLVNGVAASTISTDTHGRLVPFQGPDGYGSAAWITFGGSRTLIDPQGPFVLQADAVGFAVATPSVPQYGGFVGTANSVNRSDHAHGLGPARPLATGLASTLVFAPNLTSGAGAGTVNSMQLCPLWLSTPSRAPLTCTVIGVNVTGAATAGGTIRFGMYKAAASGGPDLTQLVFQSGDIASTSTGMKTFAYTTPIPEGLYWAATVNHVAACTITNSSHGIRVYAVGGSATGDDKMSLTGVTTTLPTSGSPVLNGDVCPQLFFTVA